MSTANYKKILLPLFFLFFICVSHAQQAPATGVKYEKKQKKKDVWKPENTQQKMEEKNEENDKLAKTPKTKWGKRRKIRKLEKQERKDYYAHQNRIQTPEVRYRQNKNEKKSKKINAHKRPGFFKRFIKKFQFNQRKVKR